MAQKLQFTKTWLKRSVDLSVAAIGMVLLAPLMATAMILVRCWLGSPVLFRQVRPGLHKRLFTLYKLRTMSDARDGQGTPLSDEARLTPLGRWLRATSLDELPQLWNVFRGEMSLVGPRPLLPIYLSRYSPSQVRRHEVKPGITGWAQIHGRNAVTWEERFRLDVWYVDNWTIGVDLKILVLSGWKVLRREGIAQEGRVTMTEFMGTARGMQEKH